MSVYTYKPELHGHTCISQKKNLYTFITQIYPMSWFYTHTHIHTEQSPLSHKPFCNGFPCFASVRGKRVVVEGREAFCCCYKSPARSLTPLSLPFLHPMLSHNAPSARHTISPTAREPLEKVSFTAKPLSIPPHFRLLTLSHSSG